MAQREYLRAPERRQRQESVLRQGESRARLRVPIEEERRQVAHQLQLQQGGRQGQAELPARVPTRETADYGARYVPDETVDAASFLDGPAAGGLPVSVNRRTEYQGTNQRNGADLFSEYTQVRGGVADGRLTGRGDEVRGGYGDGRITGYPYQYTASDRYEPAAYDAYEFAYPYLRPEEPHRPRGYPNQMTMEAQQYGSGRLTSTGQNDAYGGAPPSSRPHRYDGRLPLYSQHQTKHGLSRDGVGGQPDYSSRRAYRAPSNISKVSKSSVVSRGTQCSIVTTQTAVGPRNKTRGASRHHHHQQQVEATASSMGRCAPPPDTHNTHNGQNNGSGGGLFGGMFSGLGSLLGGGRASGAVREETRESPLDRRSNRRHIDDRYANGAQGRSYESRYHREPKTDRQQEVEAYARELDYWKGFWEMELQERSEIQERLRRQLEERAAEREKKMERFHRQQKEKMEREWREVEAKKDEMRRKEQELEEKEKEIDQQLQQLQHQMQQLQHQQQQRLNSDNETADNQQPSSTSDTVPPTPTGAVQEASRVAEADATGERQRARQMLQELESNPNFKNLTVPSASGGRPHEV
ncbi:unnamed protein product [Vitrella brassicaformis CCMP3155]|uniref:Uncharacterized protein n=1 Tax=Vitrella brassicaformis (strain CCMP3155) TaxID=1169540 RepID=A0A0G4FLF1_VITBC|nr:unnamed protein product [Vitrella brassicaformis CCMP3155]|eukprot:CEM14593.1 unnamed protein product [Vitrella brassicaformis CCMP3155]